jgi:RNA-directed DNA polymerase
MSKTKPFSISKKTVGDAYKRVKANKGAAGVDAETLEEFEKKLEDNLYKIWNRMSSGSYFPPPVRVVEINKDETRKRKLGIPTVADRIAQMVVKICLEPCIEPHFHSDSYGYRPGKSAIQAVGKARERCWKHNYVLDLDIKGFFDNIDHEITLRLLEKHTDCRWVLLYIERWLKAPAQLKDGTLCKRTKGTPQGGVISPLLANLYLHYAFDEWMKATHPAIPFERYADDIIVHCRSEKQAHWLKARIKERLALYKLELHPDKTKMAYCKDGKRKGSYKNESFVFLGFEFRPRKAKAKHRKPFTGFNPVVSREAIKGMYEKIREWRIQRRTGSTIHEIARKINPIVSGWFNYYGKYYKSTLFRIWNHINFRLVKWSARKYKRFKGSLRRAKRWLDRIRSKEPSLFVHWRVMEGGMRMVGQ